MKKKSVNNNHFDFTLNALIDRISSFQCPQLGIGIWDMNNQSYERFTIKDPADLRYNLEVWDKNCNAPYADALYAFSHLLPELNRKIYEAHKDSPVKITLEADLPSGTVYTVVCLVHPEYGMTNVSISQTMRLEAYQDVMCPRLYGDFFLSGKNAA